MNSLFAFLEGLPNGGPTLICLAIVLVVIGAASYYKYRPRTDLSDQFRRRCQRDTFKRLRWAVNHKLLGSGLIQQGLWELLADHDLSTGGVVAATVYSGDPTDPVYASFDDIFGCLGGNKIYGALTIVAADDDHATLIATVGDTQWRLRSPALNQCWGHMILETDREWIKDGLRIELPKTSEISPRAVVCKLLTFLHQHRNDSFARVKELEVNRLCSELTRSNEDYGISHLDLMVVITREVDSILTRGSWGWPLDRVVKFLRATKNASGLESEVVEIEVPLP